MAGDEELPAGPQVFPADPITSAEAILPDHDRPADRRGRVLCRRRGDQELATRRDILAVDLGVVKDVIAHGIPGDCTGATILPDDDVATDGWSTDHGALGRHREHPAGGEVLAIDITPGVAPTSAPAPPDDELAANRRRRRTSARPGNGKRAGHGLHMSGASSVSAGR